MYGQDEEHTAFITNQGLFCYKAMPFGLKNVGAVYQRLVNRIFKPLIGQKIEVYIYHMIRKSKEPEEHVKHLEENFELLKYVFGLSSGKFLGFMIRHRGIEANLENIRVIREMKSPHTLKEI